ncbi:MAG: Snf7 family protein [Candidatus Odinarchaeota archaeon]
MFLFGSWFKGSGGSGKQSAKKWAVKMRVLQRRMDRQQTKLKKDEQKQMKEVKDAVARGDMSAARLYAKDVAKTRKMALGCQRVSMRVKTISHQLEHASAIQSIGADMKGLVKSLAVMNRSLKIEGLDSVLGEFEEQMMNFDVADEQMESAFENIDFDETENTEVDNILNEVSAGVTASTVGGLSKVDAKAKDLADELKKLKES